MLCNYISVAQQFPIQSSISLIHKLQPPLYTQGWNSCSKKGMVVQSGWCIFDNEFSIQSGTPTHVQ